MTIRSNSAGRVGVCLAASIVLAACGQPTETATPDNAPPMVTPLAPTQTPTIPPDTEATDIATEAASSIWPLAADLYYLTDQGQVYRQPYQSPDSPPVMITSPDVIVSDFALAPGDEWLLVRVDGTITALSLAGKGAEVIATGTGAPQDVSRGQTMDWSGDASKITYTSPDGFQIYVSAGAGLEPYVFAIPTPDTYVIDLEWSLDSRHIAAWMDNQSGMVCDVGDPAQLQCQDLGKLNGYTWLDNGLLAVAPIGGGLLQVDPLDINSRIELVGTNFEDVRLPTQDTYGNIVFFSGDPILEYGEPYFFLPKDNMVTIGSQFGITAKGAKWDPSGLWLVTPAKGANWIDIKDAFWGDRPIQIATAGPVKQIAWGEPPPVTVSTVPMPNTLYFLGPDAGLIQLWRLAPGADSPEVLTRALADVVTYDVSLDGTKVTYTSGGAIFVQTIGADDARQIVALPADAHSPSGTPAFSPTGRRIGFANNGLFVYDTQTDTTSRLIPDSAPDAPAENLRWYDQPRYSPDGRWMIARRRTPSGSDVVVLPSGGTGINATPLNQPNARAEWTSDNKIVVYSDGSAFGLGQVNRFPAFRPGAPEVLLAAPAVDVQERLDGRIVALQQAFQLPFGPSTVRLFSFLPDGSDAQAETGSLVVESPQLSLDAVLIAGLIQTWVLTDGTVTGQLVIINPATQDVFLIDGMSHVQALMWGR